MSNAWLNADIVKKQVDMVAFVDINEENAAKRAEEHGAEGALVSTDLAAALKATKPDVVFDCTTPNAHCEVSLTGFRHGCHVFNEKPMAEDVKQAKRMIRAMRKAGKTGAIIQNRRYAKPIRSLRRFIETNKLGRITTMQSDFYLGPHFGGFREEMQHVLLLDMAIHTFDEARLISGADAEAVYCHEWNPAGSWYKHGASAVAIFEMTGGIVYTYLGSWCAEGLNTSWQATWRIVCENGTILWNGDDEIRMENVGKCKGWTRNGEVKDVPRRIGKQYLGGHNGLLNSFIDAVKNGTVPETHYEDNIKSLAMVEAAVRSAEGKKRVKVSSTKV